MSIVKGYKMMKKIIIMGLMITHSLKPLDITSEKKTALAMISGAAYMGALTWGLTELPKRLGSEYVLDSAKYFPSLSTAMSLGAIAGGLFYAFSKKEHMHLPDVGENICTDTIGFSVCTTVGYMALKRTWNPMPLVKYALPLGVVFAGLSLALQEESKLHNA